MTEEEKKEFEEFLQWKAEKKKKEEEEKREQENLEELAEQAKQERLVAEQAKAKQQATNPSTPNKWANEKSESDKFIQKVIVFICFVMIAALAIILASRVHDPNNSPATVAK